MAPLILHFVHHLVIGGMENGLVNLVNTMSWARYRHAIACIEDYSEAFRKRIGRPDVEVFALHRSELGLQRLRLEIFRLCRRLRPEIVHTRNLSGLDALLPARLAGVPRCVHGEHGWDVDDIAGEKLRPRLLRKLHSPLVGHYVTVSKDLERYLVERVGIARRRITQIYNGVDTRRFRPRMSGDKASMPETFLAPDAIVVGTVGRIQPVKDQATLLRAVAALASAQPALRTRLRVMVVGNGPLLQTLQALVEELGIAELAWLPGARDDVPDLLRMMDVFVLPSINEGISNTLLEAMASGVAVIATAVGGNVELVQEGGYGFLIPPRDVPALTERLRRYVLDPDLRVAHGRAAREAAQQRFSLQSMVARYSDLYDRVCGREPSDGVEAHADASAST